MAPITSRQLIGAIALLRSDLSKPNTNRFVNSKLYKRQTSMKPETKELINNFPPQLSEKAHLTKLSKR